MYFFFIIPKDVILISRQIYKNFVIDANNFVSFLFLPKLPSKIQNKNKSNYVSLSSIILKKL